jgi:hypothetical protein
MMGHCHGPEELIIQSLKLILYGNMKEDVFVPSILRSTDFRLQQKYPIPSIKSRLYTVFQFYRRMEYGAVS